jgi:hypothetical protein
MHIQLSKRMTVADILLKNESLINIARAVDMDYTLSGVARMVIVF